MSKSAENDLSRVNLTDDADAIRNKVSAGRTQQGRWGGGEGCQTPMQVLVVMHDHLLYDHTTK